MFGKNVGRDDVIHLFAITLLWGQDLTSSRERVFGPIFSWEQERTEKNIPNSSISRSLSLFIRFTACVMAFEGKTPTRQNTNWAINHPMGYLIQLRS